MLTKPQVIKALAKSFSQLKTLVCSLTDEQLAVPYHPGINPPVWELGHAAFFFEVFVLRRLDKINPLMPGYDSIWDSFDIDHEDRWEPGVVPPLESTLAYADEVIARVFERIESRPWTTESHYLYRYAIHHMQMHVESQIWCRQTLGYPAPFNVLPVLDDCPVSPEDCVIEGADYWFGVEEDSERFATERFAFDAEKPGMKKRVSTFRMGRYPVTQGEFCAFVEDGGYENDAFWSFGGKKWLHRKRAADYDITQGEGVPQHGPIYWKKSGPRWYRRWFDQWLPLRDGHPVMHVSYWEAEAYCRWANRRLPTEIEWEAACLANRVSAGPHAGTRLIPSRECLHPNCSDLGAVRLGTGAVSETTPCGQPNGLVAMIGTGWEWTTSPFLPYDGFRVDMYPFMSTLQFGYHKVTKGGSCATSPDLIRGTYRQAYLPFRRDVFTTFRTCPMD